MRKSIAFMIGFLTVVFLITDAATYGAVPSQAADGKYDDGSDRLIETWNPEQSESYDFDGLGDGALSQTGTVPGELQLSSTTALPNQRISISGSGFTRSSNRAGDLAAFIGNPPANARHGCSGNYLGSVTLGGNDIDWMRINDNEGIEVTSGGTWSAPIDLPVDTSTTVGGTRELKIVDCRGGVATVDLTFADREVTITPEEGGVGSEVVITGKNFPVSNDFSNSDNEVTVEYDAGIYLADDGVEPDALGNFTAILEVPEKAPVPSNNTVSVSFIDDNGTVVLETFTHRIPEALSDRDVLVALYNATDGANWTINTNWLSSEPVGEWHGVITDANGRVTALELEGNALSGEIPAELGDLTYLEWLHLGVDFHDETLPTNDLTGGMPDELTRLYYLRYLDLSGNRLAGGIPAGLGGQPFLYWINLGNNDFSGGVPVELGDLSNLERLFLYENQLSGAIPAELGGLTNLTHLWLHENQLSGVIPAELGNLSALGRLDLSNNNVSGDIPQELSNLSNLENLRLNGNRLSGSIPPELGDLSNLEHLVLSGNRLSGSIPPELGDLSNLTGLFLANNDFNGSIPPELGKLSALKNLYFSGNRGLSGPLPGSFTNLNALLILGVTGTGLCAPTDDAFQEWLDGVLLRLGVVNCSADPLFDRYDANNNGMIEKAEVIKAINDYLFGEGDEAISKAEVIRLINLYLFG